MHKNNRICIICICSEREKTVKPNDQVAFNTVLITSWFLYLFIIIYFHNCCPVTHFTPYTPSFSHLFSFDCVTQFSGPRTASPLREPHLYFHHTQKNQPSDLPLLSIGMSCESGHIQMQRSPVIRSICHPPTYHMSVSLSQGRKQGGKKPLNMRTHR